jgi:hypothetical protein
LAVLRAAPHGQLYRSGADPQKEEPSGERHSAHLMGYHPTRVRDLEIGPMAEPESCLPPEYPRTL